MDIAADEDGNVDSIQELAEEEQEHQSSTLNPESLMQLRAEMIQRLEYVIFSLHIRVLLMEQVREARYSMSTSLDLLNCLLAVNSLSANPTTTGGANPTAGLAGLTSTPAIQIPPAPVTLAPSVLTLPSTKPSVAVMNAQIGVTTRDSGIRKAAAILRKAALSTAEEIERAGRGGPGPSQGRHETSYWATALRLRQACWALLPAPLPPGAGQALKGSTRVSKDILFGFALEGSAIGYRRFAFGLILPNNSTKPPTTDEKPPLLVFPHLQNRRLQVSLRINGKKYSCPLETSTDTTPQISGLRGGSTTQTLNNLMRDAQQEIVEQEIFSELMAQARYVGALVSQFSANIMELDITQDMTLMFERVLTEEEDTKNEPSITDPSEPDVIVCTLIRQLLVILLARAHRGILLDGMTHSASVTPANSGTVVKKQVPILGPIINLLRYRAMVQRVDSELKKVLSGLGRAGIQATLTMSGVSEPAKAFVESLSRYLDAPGDSQLQPGSIQRPDQSLALSGEALLRIADRHLIQIAFHSPTLLKIHVVQAHITVHDHGQLGEFLRADVAARVVQYVQDTGKDLVAEIAKSDSRGLDFSKAWFADPIAGYCIGRWPSGKGRFQVVVRQNGRLHCEATIESQGKPSVLVFDDAQGVRLKDWVHSVMLLPFRST
ncbi:hypothetical protein FRC09_009132 [Ceratobasidium sp. 395]|nr:hypothetical protein FRC09_009132 [Ceratobasidium sp. 395]